MLSHIQPFETHWTVAHQVLLSMEFPRQESWSRLPLSTLRDIPDPGIKPVSPESPAMAGGFFTTEPPGKPICQVKRQQSTHLFMYLFSAFYLFILYCSGFCYTLTWISHGFTCIPHPYPPSHFPLHPIALGLPSAPALSTCLMHPTWAGDLFHTW